MSHVTIDPRYCKGCLRCMHTCPKACLDPSGHTNSGGYDYVAFAGEDRCTGCAMCRLVCPDVAITVYKD